MNNSRFNRCTQTVPPFCGGNILFCSSGMYYSGPHMVGKYYSVLHIVCNLCQNICNFALMASIGPYNCIIVVPRHSSLKLGSQPSLTETKYFAHSQDLLKTSSKSSHRHSSCTRDTKCARSGVKIPVKLQFLTCQGVRSILWDIQKKETLPDFGFITPCFNNY